MAETTTDNAIITKTRLKEFLGYIKDYLGDNFYNESQVNTLLSAIQKAVNLTKVDALPTGDNIKENYVYYVSKAGDGTAPYTMHIYDKANSDWINLGTSDVVLEGFLTEAEAENNYLKKANPTFTGTLKGPSATFSTSVSTPKVLLSGNTLKAASTDAVTWTLPAVTGYIPLPAYRTDAEKYTYSQDVKIDISTGKLYTTVGKTYNTATKDVAGLVKLASDVQISHSQCTTTDNADIASSRLYGIQLNSENRMVVNVPWESYTIASEAKEGLIRPYLYHSVASTGRTAKSDATSIKLEGTPEGYRSKYYVLEMDSRGFGFVNVPWTDTTYSAATTSAAGLMSAADKTKLDDIATGATNVSVDSALDTNSENAIQNKVVSSEFKKYLPLAGGSMSGNITMSGTSGSIIFSYSGTEYARIDNSGYASFNTQVKTPKLVITSSTGASGIITQPAKDTAIVLPSSSGVLALASDIPTITYANSDDIEAMFN